MNNSAFLILFFAIIGLMGLIPFLLRRFNIPTVISLLLVGILIGPTGIGIDMIGTISRWLSFLGTPGMEAQTALETAADFNMLIDSLGALGLVLLMALAGMEADFKLIKSVRVPVIVLSIATFLIPAIAGYFVYRHFKPGDLAGKILYASLFASHSVGIVFPVMRELKLSKTRFGSAVLISTVITDISSIVLLAVSVQIFRQDSHISHSFVATSLSLLDRMDGMLPGTSFVPLFLLLVVVFLVLAMILVNLAGRLLIRLFHPGEDMLITFVILVILTTVLAGELLGINSIVGAFIAGLGLSTIVKQRDMLLFRRVESIGYGFLIPFLFLSIGMKTDFTVFSQAGNWSIVLWTVIGLVCSKILSGFAAMRLCGFSALQGWAAGLMTVPQLSATLAAAAIGKELGMLDGEFFNAIIILSVVTTLPIPSLVKWVISRSGDQFSELPGASVPRVVKDDDLL